MAKAETASAWVVYMVRCADGKLYTGITNDLNGRITAHNNGTGARFTRGRAPVVPVYSEQHDNRSCASKRERQIKQLTREKKLKLAGLL